MIVIHKELVFCRVCHTLTRASLVASWKYPGHSRHSPSLLALHVACQVARTCELVHSVSVSRHYICSGEFLTADEGLAATTVWGSEPWTLTTFMSNDFDEAEEMCRTRTQLPALHRKRRRLMIQRPPSKVAELSFLAKTLPDDDTKVVPRSTQKKLVTSTIQSNHGRPKKKRISWKVCFQLWIVFSVLPI